MILFGANPIAWANDDDQTLGAHIPTEQILSEASEIGLTASRTATAGRTIKEELKQLLGSHGLKFVSGWYSLNLLAQTVEDEKKAIQPHLDKLRHNGCKVCIACETSNTIQGSDVDISTSPVLSDEEMKSFGAKVEELRRILCGPGHRSCLPPPHGHGGGNPCGNRRLHGGNRTGHKASV